jgi:hypothetical protein
MFAKSRANGARVDHRGDGISKFFVRTCDNAPARRMPPRAGIAGIRRVAKQKSGVRIDSIFLLDCELFPWDASRLRAILA